jgi:hypothetical protein
MVMENRVDVSKIDNQSPNPLITLITICVAPRNDRLKNALWDELKEVVGDNLSES